MKTNINKLILGLLILVTFSCYAFIKIQNKDSGSILSYRVDLTKQSLKFYWKNDRGENFKGFEQLKKWVESKSEKLVFAMNGGMYKKDFSPLGLYVENGKVKAELNKVQNAFGNFYLQPNGVFYITNNDKGEICKTTNFSYNNIKYATQSGPLLVIDGEIHPKFREGSKNVNIRNGVGVLPNGELLFAMSERKINFYDFADYFKSKGCKNALYLDGYVSRTYLPEKGKTNTQGNFGVIIGETTK